MDQKLGKKNIKEPGGNTHTSLDTLTTQLRRFLADETDVETISATIVVC